MDEGVDGGIDAAPAPAPVPASTPATSRRGNISLKSLAYEDEDDDDLFDPDEEEEKGTDRRECLIKRGEGGKTGRADKLSVIV
jgi:hypothetical protein